MSPQRWTLEQITDLMKFGSAAVLAAAPWILGFDGTPALNAWLSGYAVAAGTLAALTAEADWEGRASLVLGTWITVSPWLLAVPADAVSVHVICGTGIAALAVAKLWLRKPPRATQS